jgi:hypothetical protein
VGSLQSGSTGARLATTGGVVSTTRVAGLTLGGGSGWLTPKFGMALDNLLGVEIVLADGRIVRTAAEENPDLFWAVGGGGGNFGVVSSFEFRLHEVGPLVTGGIVAWPVERAREMLLLFRDLAERATDEVMLFAVLMTAPDGATRVSVIGAGYFGPSNIGSPSSNRARRSISQSWTPSGRFRMSNATRASTLPFPEVPETTGNRTSASS